MKRTTICLALLVAFLVTVALPADIIAAVEREMVTGFDAPVKLDKRAARKARRAAKRLQKSSSLDEFDAQIQAMMDLANENLAALGADYRWAITEYLTESDHVGRTVFFSDVGNKQLSSDFAPGDPRRLWSGAGPGDDITWASDTSLAEGGAPGIGIAATQAAIGNAMATWQNVNCSNLPLTFFNYPPIDLGFIPTFFGLPGAPGIAADLTHAGFGTVLDPFLPPPIIGATFTLIFIDPATGIPTDIDNNGKTDTALREIFYTNNFPWAINGNIDVETVVLHEAGHGLSQAHFGKLSRTDRNGKFHFSPRAVMNAGYTGPQQSLLGSDRAGHCSNWANWPNN